MGKGSASASRQDVKASIREAIVKLTDDKGLQRINDAEPVKQITEKVSGGPARSKSGRLVS